MPDTVPSHADGRDLTVVVLVTRWYPEIVAGLKAGALEVLATAQVDERRIAVVEVPGAYELPQVAAWVARDGLHGRPVDAVVALGCVVRGETPHFDLVARAAGDGLLRVALDTGVPVGLGVITADTLEQARARARSGAGGTGGTYGGTTKGGNKGAEAADAAVRLAATRRALREPRP